MADEESSTPTLKPNTLSAMKWDEVKARAQRIVDTRGKWPPYTKADFDGYVSEDEAAVLSEFVYFWQPYIILRGEPSGT